MKTITILGAGSWGIALARLLHRNKHAVTLWEFDSSQVEILLQERQLKQKLPGVLLDEDIGITGNLKESLKGSELAVLAVPAPVMRDVCKAACPLVDKTRPPLWVSVAKGLERGTQKRMSQVVSEELASCRLLKVAVLSGPSHAEEVGRDFPTTVVAAADEQAVAEEVQETFFGPSFRVYTSQDVLGVEIGGALKNVIAIAAGICDGLGFGDNTKAALVTRGLAEITRLGVTMGADPATFAGLSCLGDLVVTCCSPHSRNYRLGRLLAQGKSLEAALDSIGMAVEGVNTAVSVGALCARYEVEMPIASEIEAVLFAGKSPQRAVADLMLREPKQEVEHGNHG